MLFNYFIISLGEFDYVEEKDADGVVHRVYTALGKKEDGLYALKVRIYRKLYVLPKSV